MTPERRERLVALLAQTRQADADRRLALANADADVLVHLTGLRDAALCRRIVATPRVARRLAGQLEAAKAEVQRQRAAAVAAARAPAEVEPTDDGTRSLSDNPIAPEAPAAASHLPPLVTAEALIDALSAAIRLAGAGPLVPSTEVKAVRESHGEAATEFGLARRSAVPGWMVAAGGQRRDILRQLSLTALACWEERPTGLALAENGAEDAILIGPSGLRQAAGALAGDAARFLSARAPAPEPQGERA